MTDLMALDIETGNYSWEIGGWNKTALFEPVVVATWDGNDSHVFTNEDVSFDDIHVHPLHPRNLGEHLEKHVEKGGKIIGHNLLTFDLPILKNALDCHYAGVLMGKRDAVIDTARVLSSTIGNRIPLDDVCKHTLGQGKGGMDSMAAPIAWRNGEYEKVAKYCVDDCKLVYELWNAGRADGIIKTRDMKSGDIIEVEVEWND